MEHDGTKTILVVEDDDVLRSVMVEVLTEMHYRVVETSDGLEGLDCLSECPEHIDLLLTDVGLPGMDGIELAQRGRELRPGLAVLFVTGHAHETGDMPLAEGMRLMVKPFSLKQLSVQVRHLVSA